MTVTFPQMSAPFAFASFHTDSPSLCVSCVRDASAFSFDFWESFALQVGVVIDHWLPGPRVEGLSVPSVSWFPGLHFSLAFVSVFDLKENTMGSGLLEGEGYSFIVE